MNDRILLDVEPATDPTCRLLLETASAPLLPLDDNSDSSIPDLIAALKEHDQLAANSARSRAHSSDDSVPSVQSTSHSSSACEQQQHHWHLRNTSRHCSFASTSTTTLPTTTTSASLLASSSSQRYYNNSLEDVPENVGGLRASLDAGMVAVQGWIRSRITTGSSTTSIMATSSTAMRQHRHDPTEIRRQRTYSEPDANNIQSYLQEQQQSSMTSPYYYCHYSPQQPQNVRRRRLRAFTEDAQLSSVAAAALQTTLFPTSTTTTTTAVANSSATPSHQRHYTAASSTPATPTAGDIFSATPTTTAVSPTHNSGNSNHASNSTMGAASAAASVIPNVDPERRARMRWIRINRRFQLVITIVALLFSLLLFSILICWVVLTSVFAVSFDKSCDVPLKPYYWLVTFQLVLDVFRSDIMRFVFSWDANSNQRIPCRVLAYNLAYLAYAMLVLRLGIICIFFQDGTCEKTAPELFNASAAFISLSIAAWVTILGGYLLPFCVVAAMLTYNGYNPASLDTMADMPAVFPAAYSSTGAPAGCIELLPVVQVVCDGDFPRECCICMEEFRTTDMVVETGCKHLFHKQCCREWLLQARTCPVCRTDVPSHLPLNGSGSSSPPPSSQIPIGPTGRPVVGLLRLLHHSEGSSLVSHHPNTPGDVPSRVPRSPSVGLVHPVEAPTIATTIQQQQDLEDGRRTYM
jgi:hypothetical protein